MFSGRPLNEGFWQPQCPMRYVSLTLSEERLICDERDAPIQRGANSDLISLQQSRRYQGLHNKVKSPSERISVLVCFKLNWSDKYELMIIGSSWKPSPFKKIRCCIGLRLSREQEGMYDTDPILPSSEAILGAHL